jgi:RNA polymerase sigma-70 factor (ECF subfamily)
MHVPPVPPQSNTSGNGRESSVDGRQLGSVLEGYRGRLQHMIALRLDPRLRRRFDSSDVIQEAFVDVMRRFEEYRACSEMSFFLWVRLLTSQKLMEFHRRHLGAEKRDVRREVAARSYPEASSISLARALVDQGSSPSQALVRKEREERLREALEKVKEVDREILMLRHFERLSNDECADVLGLSPSGTNVRHWRAAKRLREILAEHHDLLDGLPGPQDQERES